MNRLQTEVHRLYLPQATGTEGTAPDDAPLVDGAGRVRALVLELSMPADWEATSRLWNGVQADLELPAPAIAVSGTDGYQLWFSLSQPVPAAQAAAFLESLRERYLNDVKSRRVTCMPAVAAADAAGELRAGQVPPRQVGAEAWSAFVAPDLAPMFAEEPWLDLPPGLDGQSGLLSRLKSIAPGDFQRALERLQPAAGTGRPGPAAAGGGEATAGASPVAVRSTPVGESLDPRRFLLDVMNDPAVALALRIEAAKALLPHVGNPGRT